MRHKVQAWIVRKPECGAVASFLFFIFFLCGFQLLFDTEEFLTRFWRDISIALPIAILTGIVVYVWAKRFQTGQES